MLSHILIQLPLLALLGGWAALRIADAYRIQLAYHHALPLVILALTTAMFWMIPKSIDAALESEAYAAGKFISLPLLLGAPLALGWRHVGAITRAFVIANLLSMLIVLGWLYIEAPVRLCNYYLINEQQLLGQAMLYIGASIALLYTVRVFAGSRGDT